MREGHIKASSRSQDGVAVAEDPMPVHHLEAEVAVRSLPITVTRVDQARVSLSRIDQLADEGRIQPTQIGGNGKHPDPRGRARRLREAVL